MTKSLLELKNIGAGYGEFRVLFDVNLNVEKGEIVALVGPNGAGKTTTLRTIMGMTTLYSGDIIYNGTSIKKLPTHKRVELGINMVPEGRRIFKTLTVYENLVAGAYTKRAREKLDDTLEFVYSLFPRLKERKNQKNFQRLAKSSLMKRQKGKLLFIMNIPRLRSRLSLTLDFFPKKEKYSE